MSFLSPRMAALDQALAEGPAQALEQFWQEIAQHGSPLVEPALDQPQERLVTFLWRDTAGTTTNVVLLGGLVAWFDVDGDKYAGRSIPTPPSWIPCWPQAGFHPWWPCCSTMPGGPSVIWGSVWRNPALGGDLGCSPCRTLAATHERQHEGNES